MKPLTQQLLTFIDNSPTPFHATQNVRQQLDAHGFQALDESEAWNLEQGQKYYTTRAGGAIIAWTMGRQSPTATGFRLIGWHTDSPNLRLKPEATFCQQGYRQLNVEVYGGVLLSSWLDRDLSLAGRLLVEEEGKISDKLIHVKKPLLRIPLLAIHLNRDVNREGLKLNPQRHLKPIYSLEESEDSLLQFLAKEAEAERILSYDLALCDTQPSTLLGLHDEWIAAPRLDNLFSGFCATQALIKAGEGFDGTCVSLGFDHEEIGSETGAGAKSSFAACVLNRICESYCPKLQTEDVARAFAKSFLISADMAHALHPNYVDRHDEHLHPKMNAGLVVKSNVNGRYMTSGESVAIFENLCQSINQPVQNFASRNDMGCGSTIAPYLASHLGITTIDVGAAMLSMHSVREICGVHDLHATQQVFSHFFQTPSLTQLSSC